MITQQHASDVASRVMDALPIAVIGLSRRNAVTFLNSAAESLLGKSAPVLRGRLLTDVIAGDSPLNDFLVRARQEGGVVTARNMRLSGPTLSPVEVDVTASPDGDDGGVALALLPPRTPQDQDANAEVAAVTQIARVLGHEVKNPLAGIVGAAQLLLRQARPEQHALLSLIKEEGARIERIVDRFTAFETFFAPRLRSTNVHAVIDSTISLAQASFGSQTRFELLYDPSLPEIEVDPDHLHEACLNLVKNAIEAVIQSGGKPRIRVQTRYRAGFRFSGTEPRRTRGALEIAISDNGPGVPDSAIGRVFEPFYTTKAGGAGVGLAVVSEIMTAHGGFVQLDNSPSGACFRLLFPIARTKGASSP